MAGKKFHRSSSDKKIAGVCGGLAEYFGMDALLVRVLMVALVFVGGIGLLIYVLLWLLAPEA
jgi:phage shock protein PspC (stress-responsive transcriptional regulator)